MFMPIRPLQTEAHAYTEADVARLEGLSQALRDANTDIVRVCLTEC